MLYRKSERYYQQSMINFVSLRVCVIPLNICTSLTKHELEKAKFLLCILKDYEEDFVNKEIVAWGKNYLQLTKLPEFYFVLTKDVSFTLL